MHGRLRRNIFRPHQRLPAAVLPLAATLLLTILFFSSLSAKLRPLVRTVAVSRATSLISVAVGEETVNALAAEGLGYRDFVDMATDDGGRVVSLSVNAAESAGFRDLVTRRLVERFRGIGSDELSVPMGELTGLLVLSSVGPPVRVRIRSVGDVQAQLESEFGSAGVNQTRHSVWFNVSATIYLLIPGEIVPVTVEERVCVAETIIVGQVPDTYLNLQQNEGN